MTTKYLLGLLTAICLMAGTVVAQQSATSTNLDETSDDLDEWNSVAQVSLFSGGSYLGISTEDISRDNMATYNLSQPRGVGVKQVVKDSPAEKAGLRKGDVILRFDGENVTSVRKLNRLISEVAPDQTVRVSISRSGAEQELSATIAKRTHSFARFDSGGDVAKVWKWEGPVISSDNFSFSFGNSRRLGVSTSELTKQLADFFGVPGGKGVLVTSVIEEDPAAKAGIKAGDVITSIDGEAVDSPGDISRILNSKKDGEVTVTFIRNKTQQTVRVAPKVGQHIPRTLVRPQVGRTIVIPRVQFPPFPEVGVALPSMNIAIPSVNVATPIVNVAVPNMNVGMPSLNISSPMIQIPVLPAVNIQMPAIKVTPKVKAKARIVQPM